MKHSVFLAIVSAFLGFAQPASARDLNSEETLQEQQYQAILRGAAEGGRIVLRNAAIDGSWEMLRPVTGLVNTRTCTTIFAAPQATKLVAVNDPAPQMGVDWTELTEGEARKGVVEMRFPWVGETNTAQLLIEDEAVLADVVDAIGGLVELCRPRTVTAAGTGGAHSATARPQSAEILARLSEQCNQSRYFAGGLNYWQHRSQRPSQQKSDQDQRERAMNYADARISCLKDAGQQIPSEIRYGPEFQALLDGSADYLDNLMRKGRSEFEAAPGKYSFINGPFFAGDTTAAKLREILARSAAIPSVAQKCGSFDYTQPLLDSASLARKRAEFERYRTCVNDYDSIIYSLLMFEFEKSRKELDAIAPYRCSVRPGQDCILDASWSEFSNIASPANVALIQARRKWQDSQLDVRRNELDKLSDFLRVYNQRVEAHNRGS